MDSPPGPAIYLVALVFLIGLAYTFPVLAGFSSPISGLIYGFALWEAWKINRGVTLTFNGPFGLAAARPGARTGSRKLLAASEPQQEMRL